MKLHVLVLLSALLVRGRGCDEILQESIKHQLIYIDEMGPDGFREVFPKDYEISHPYNDSLLCDNDPCCVFQAAADLSHSWFQLLLKLWRQHYRHPFIRELKRNLNQISNQISGIHSTKANVVVSSPETLLNYTKAVFSKWLDQCALTEKSLCEASTSNTPLKDEEEENRVYSHQIEDKFSSDQTQPGGAVSPIPPSVFIYLASFSVLCFAQSIF
uniref:Zgc:174888 n=1 Tax=Paramormyrops kingsleyae TaxID=1676925 RepID=A0A3B3SNG2_9TELE